MQSHYIPQQYVYETLSVPVELVPVVKSLIDSHNSKLISMILPTSTQALPPLPPPPPTSSQPLLPPPNESSRFEQSLSKKPNYRNDPRLDLKYSNHTLCIDWLKDECKNKTCIFDHYKPYYYKKEMCDHWKNYHCRYDSIDCKRVHGHSDPYSRLPKNSHSRSRSRSREKN
jgi:hypothetical protein